MYIMFDSVILIEDEIKLYRKFRHKKSVIRRAFRLAGVYINPGPYTLTGQRFVDPPADPALDGSPDPVIPVGVLPRFILMMQPEQVHESPGPDLFQSGAGLGMKVHVILQPLRVMNIDGFRCDIEIAHPQQRLPGRIVSYN